LLLNITSPKYKRFHGGHSGGLPHNIPFTSPLCAVSRRCGFVCPTPLPEVDSDSFKSTEHSQDGVTGTGFTLLPEIN